MSGEATVQRIDPAPDRDRGALRCLLAGGGLLVLATLAGLTFGGAPAQATFPGINGKLFCQEGSAPGPATKAQNIFSINPDGTGRALVTNTTLINPADPTSGFSNNRDVRVSPDGKRMVFSSNRNGALSLYTMNSDGTGPATLVADPVAGSFGFLSSSWSPDGTKIFTSELFPGGNAEIFSMNADGSNQVNLTNRSSQEVAPVMSPDGRKILFHSNLNFASISPGDQDIYSMDPDGSNIQNITNDSNVDRRDVYPNWSPDGTQFVFERLSTNFANSNIYKMNADGTGLTQLTFGTVQPAGGTGLNRNPVWSPDGTRISFDSERDNLTANPRNREVYTMRTDGTDVQRVTNAPGADAQCDWQTIPRPAAVPPPPVYPQPQPQPQPSAAFAGCPASTTHVILGTAAADKITGTTAGDRIFAGTGNDVVDALAGNDCVDLGTGDDRGQGGLGNDLIVAGQGNDRVSGSSGNDNLRGNPGNDRLDGGRGNDSVFGDAGNDTLLGGFGNDRLHGVSGRDVISGSRGRDRINGGSGNDRISGGSGGDKIAGDAGNDSINGNSGADRISGNSGNDRITSADNSRDRVNCGSGRDSVVADRKDIVARNCERVRRR